MKNIILFHCLYIFFTILLLIFYFHYQLFLFFRPDKIYNYNFDYILNNYCQNFSSTMTELEKYACDNKYKKSKFIWFSVDGLANDQLYYLLNQSRFKISNFYYPNVHPFKITGSSYETYLTGKFNRNLNYSTIKKDNLINQMTDNAKMFVEYDGLKVPFGHFFENRKAFSNITQRTEEEKYPGLNFCNIGVDVYDENIQNAFKKFTDKNGYLKDGHSKDEVFNYLNKYFEEKGFNYTLDECFEDRNITYNNSILFYSDIIDHLNHQYFKCHIFQYQNIFALETFMIQLFNWIDNNPDYALIFNSDHGGASFHGEDHFEPHGNNFDIKNFATFFVYTKELGDIYEKKDKKVINSFNCAPTIVQIIKNINIPLETEGVPEFLGNDEILRVAAIKSKEFQIKSLFYNYKKKYSNKFLDNIEKKFNNSDFRKFDSLDNFTLDNSINYIKFLNDTQKEITKQLLKKTSNFHIYFFSLIFFLKSILDGFIFFKSKLFKNEDNKKLSIYIHILFLFLFNYDNIFLFIYPFNFLYDNIRWSKISLLFIIIFVKGYLIKKKKLLDKEFIMFYLLLFISCLLIIFYYCNIFNKIHVFFFKIKMYQYSYLTLFLIFGILLTIWQFREFKNVYLFKNFSILNLFIIISIIINLLLLLFNRQDFYFHKKIENYGIILKKNIFTLLILLFIFSVVPIKYKINNKTIIPNFIYFKFLYYFLFYFFAFDSEIFFILFLITPILESIIYYYDLLKKEKYLQILLILVIINFIDLFFFSTHKLLTIEISTNYIKYKKILNSKFHKILNHFFEFKFFVIIPFYILNCLKLNKNFSLTKISNFIIYILLIRFNLLFLAFLKNYYFLGIEDDFIYDFFNLLYCKGFEFIIFFGIFIIFMLLIYIIQKLEYLYYEIFNKNKKINLIEEDISSIVRESKE